MTSNVIDFANARARRATGQRLFDSPAPQPVRIATTGAPVCNRHDQRRRIGTITEFFDVCGLRYARVRYPLPDLPAAIPLRDLVFLTGNPERA